MSLAKWDPFEALFEFQKAAQSVARPVNKDDWLPSVDIHEDKEAFYFDVEAPGIKKEDFDIKVENSILTIKGERKREEEKKDKNYYRIEREYGTFARSFSLPDTADSEKVSAEYKSGILHVKLAKKEVAKPRQIEVKVA